MESVVSCVVWDGDRLLWKWNLLHQGPQTAELKRDRDGGVS